MQIVGVGFNDPETNNEWAIQEAFEYELWTDGDHTLVDTYDAVDFDILVRRVTLILDEEGFLLVRYSEDTGESGHPAVVLEDCELLFGD